MSRPLGLHDAVADVIEEVDEAPTVWQAELAVSELLGRDWLPLPLGRGILVDIHLRLVTEEAAKFGGHARTLQAVLAHLTANETTLVRVNMSARALGVLQPWVPLLDTVELIEASEATEGGQIVLHCGYWLGDGLVDEHYLVLGIQEGIVQRCDVGPDAPEFTTRTVDPADIAPRIATLMAETTWHFKKLRDPDAVNGPWALLSARLRTCLPPVLAITKMLPEDVTALANRFMRLKATKRLVDEHEHTGCYARNIAIQVIEFERDVCSGGWTPEAVRRFYAERASRIHCDGDEELLGQVVIGYLVWRMGKLGYKPLVEQASAAHVEYLETL